MFSCEICKIFFHDQKNKNLPETKNIGRKTLRKNMFHEETVRHGKFPKSKKFVKINEKPRIYLLAVNLSLRRWFLRQQILSFSLVDIDMYH